MYTQSDTSFILNDNDIFITTTRGSGNGGQAINKIESCVVVTHKKTGISVRCQNERSQSQNKILAIELLKAKLEKIQKKKELTESQRIRELQVGNLNRGSDKKIKIYKEKLNMILDVRTSEKKSLSEWMKGNI